MRLFFGNIKKQMKKTKIVTIGGGTGTFVVLSGLKAYENLELTAVISSADDGGSNKKFRDEFGLIPPSDFRQCLVALSDDSNEGNHIDLLRKLFMYRFEKGEGMIGQTFGNMFIAALTDILGSQTKAIEEIGKVLNIKGKILPITLQNIRLVARYEDGITVFGEHLIDEPENIKIFGQRIVSLSTDVKASVYSHSQKAIEEAEYIILGPGDLYTSTLANIVVGDMSDILKQYKGKLVYVMNLMTKKGQTDNFTAKDHVDELFNYIGRFPDFVLINSGSIKDSVLEWYEKSGEVLVKDNLNGECCKIIRADVISNVDFNKDGSDILRRSVLRHDSKKLAMMLMSEVVDRG